MSENGQIWTSIACMVFPWDLIMTLVTGRSPRGMRVSRQARPIAFCKVERHGNDDTHCRSLGPTPFWGWSPVLASDSSHFPLHLTAGI